ncbi:MAG TPA: HU family DNA-binding protein [Mycobacteriales bacterium]|jgi:DNA-binding protein HU-beta|nr:HU family DNA-binding protein [Mycobacteriales bacterium]
MNRQQLITDVAQRAEVPAGQVAQVLDAIRDSIAAAVSEGDKVTVPGFVTVERGHRAARTGRNPQTGEAIQIAAAYTVKISAGSTLKSAVKQ